MKKVLKRRKKDILQKQILKDVNDSLKGEKSSKKLWVLLAIVLLIIVAGGVVALLNTSSPTGDSSLDQLALLLAVETDLEFDEARDLVGSAMGEQSVEKMMERLKVRMRQDAPIVCKDSINEDECTKAALTIQENLIEQTSESKLKTKKKVEIPSDVLTMKDEDGAGFKVCNIPLTHLSQSTKDLIKNSPAAKCRDGVVHDTTNVPDSLVRDSQNNPIINKFNNKLTGEVKNDMLVCQVSCLDINVLSFATCHNLKYGPQANTIPVYGSC